MAYISTEPLSMASVAVVRMTSSVTMNSGMEAMASIVVVGVASTQMRLGVVRR